MGAVKVMSIIGIVLYVLCFLGLLVAGDDNDIEAAVGIGIILSAYGLGYAITALVQANKIIKQNK